MSVEEQIQKAFERVDAKIHDMYVEKLMNHDWTSDMSDDHRRFTDGMKEYEEILSIARNVDKEYKIFNIYAPDGYKKNIKPFSSDDYDEYGVRQSTSFNTPPKRESKDDN